MILWDGKNDSDATTKTGRYRYKSGSVAPRRDYFYDLIDQDGTHIRIEIRGLRVEQLLAQGEDGWQQVARAARRGWEAAKRELDLPVSVPAQSERVEKVRSFLSWLR